jgi:hypothetical protein
MWIRLNGIVVDPVEASVLSDFNLSLIFSLLYYVKLTTYSSPGALLK